MTDVNMDEVKTFYDPHPGIGGAVVPMPRPIKKVADELAGKSMTLREAVQKVEEAAGQGIVKVVSEPEFHYIRFETKTLKQALEEESDDNPRHSWRVIRFR
jgi:hypothetical protein